MKKGFTLIELLVVIAILAVISVTGLTIYQGNLQRSQDEKRIQQMNNLKQSLELYRNKNSSYPKTLSEIAPVYIESLPQDPSGRAYQYLALPNPSCTTVNRNCVSYVICAKKDGNKSFTVPSECASLNCGGTSGDCNMGVKE